MARYILPPVSIILIIVFTTPLLVKGDLFTFPVPQPSGKDITDKVFKTFGNQDVFPVAYGDFNADKLTDIITVDRNRSSIYIFFAHKDIPYMRPGPEWHFHFDKNTTGIAGVTLGDFTGDGLMDLMVTLNKNRTFTFVDVDIACYNNTGTGLTSNSSNATSVTLNFVELVFCLGNSRQINCTSTTPGPSDLVQEPMILDLNDDMILDLVGEVWEVNLYKNISVYKYNETCNVTQTQHDMKFNKTRSIWISEEDRPAIRHQRFHVKNNTTLLEHFEMAYPSSNAFVDVDGDLIPELVLITCPIKPIIWNSSDVQSQTQIDFQRETYRILPDVGKKHGHVDFHIKSIHKIDPDGKDSVQVIGQPLFLDLERNGQLLHLFPFCSDQHCKNQNGIKVIYQGETIDLPLGAFTYDGLSWNFIKPQLQPDLNETSNDISMEDFYSAALTLRSGDYNLDGYPDLIGVLETFSKSINRKRTKGVIFENVPCIPTRGKPCLLSRTFNPNFGFLDEFENVISASFFDIQENGMADVFLIQQSSSLNSHPINQTFQLRAFKNSPNFDSYFMKVVVLTGRACPNCPENNTPYGSLIPGALMTYQMRGQNEQDQTAVSAQMYRSAHMPLDLPYAIFGIGHSPNFVELLNISVAYNESRKYVHSSHQIVPNSHIMIIPSPVDMPSKWKVKLFLTPSDAVVHTFGVLIGILLVVGVIAAGLEFKEKREDRHVRMAEAHRFMM